MYYSISGKVVFFEEGRLVVECNGLAYDVMVSNNTLSMLGVIGNDVTVYTTLRITDDAIKLYGFYTKEEKAMFLKLTSINGVGPKTALVILSSIDPKTLALNIVESDYKALAKVKGIGKKTAMRIIMELKEKLEEEDWDAIGGGSTMSIKLKDQISQDAILALSSLGMSKSEASKAVAEYRGKASSIEEIITLVLKGMR